MKTYLLNLLDRAGRTALQVAAGYLAAGRGTVDWRVIVLATALAVVISVLQSVVDFPAIPGGLLTDVTGRALRTFAQTALGSLGAAVLITDVPWTTVLTASALAAITSVVTSGITTSIGPAKGTPNLITSVSYTGYTDDHSRHLRPPGATTTSLVATTAAVLAFAAVTTVGITAAHRTQTRVVAMPGPQQTAPPVSAPATPDRAPAYYTALNRNGIATAGDHAPLLLIANSVCTARGTTSDAQLTDQIVATFGGKWTPLQAAVIVDSAVDSYCG